MIRFTAQDKAVTFTVRVQPRATKSALAGEVEGTLKIKIASPPVDGAANEELLRYLAQLFAVPRRAVTILSGEMAKNKIVRIQGITGAQFATTIRQKMKDEG
jgi:uncharacterized protein